MLLLQLDRIEVESPGAPVKFTGDPNPEMGEGGQSLVKARHDGRTMLKFLRIDKGARDFVGLLAPVAWETEAIAVSGRAGYKAPQRGAHGRAI